MDKMEVQLMNLAALVQTAVARDSGSRPGSARSNTSINSNTNSAHSSKYMMSIITSVGFNKSRLTSEFKP